MIDNAEILVFALCFVFSGFFSGSEAVLMSIGIDRAKQLIEEGGTKGRAMKFMTSNSSELLTTILVGNNIANIFAASLATDMSSRLFANDAIGIAVGVTTILTLIFGEIIPKTFSRTHAEKLSVFVIRVLQTFYYLWYPVIFVTVAIIQKVLGENAEVKGRVVTKNDIEFMLDRAEKEKTMDSKQIELLNSILEFPTIKVKDIMIPRNQVKFLELESSFNDMIQVIQKDVHSRYPVCRRELDNVIGFLHVKDLAFVSFSNNDNFNVTKFLKKPFFVYEHMRIQAVFDYMNRMKVHLALVKDENGLIVGIVTLEDIVEEIVGEIQDEHDIEEDDTENPVGRSKIIVEGTISLRDLYTEYDVKIPLNDSYSTLSGFILDMLGNNFPEEGQIIVWEGLKFELSKVNEFEIREVTINDVDGDKHIYSKKDAFSGNN